MSLMITLMLCDDEFLQQQQQQQNRHIRFEESYRIKQGT